MSYAIDSSTILLLLKNNESVCAKRDQVIKTGARLSIPPVVDYEIRRGFLYKPYPKKEKIYTSLVDHYGVGEMSTQSWRLAARIYAELRNKGFTVGDADILIASFCIVNELTLVSTNTNHFEKINDLKLENWAG